MSLFNWINNKINQSEINKIEKIVDRILSLEDKIKELSDEALFLKTQEFRNLIEDGKSLDDILIEAYAVVREASFRVVGLKHYKAQLIAGIILHRGDIAEMKTGEGKTLAATAPVYLNALKGEGVHVVTANDYLAHRDKEWMGKIYEFLGLTVGCIQSTSSVEERKKAYNCDITYGSSSEFGFDYLKDNMAIKFEYKMQRPHNYVLIDEIDSILIDEARTPLIISAPSKEMNTLYEKSNKFILTLKKDIDYTIKEKEKIAVLEDSGVKKAEEFFKIDNLSDIQNLDINHYINQSLYAHSLTKKDLDYIVQDGEILIIDENTGRVMPGRRYTNGLHQAIEAKEKIKSKGETKTYASITLQNYFKLYKKISGMTGTAKTEENEFKQIYNLNVCCVPTNKPVIRKDNPDLVFKTEKAKLNAIIKEIKDRHFLGQPILVGTISIENSEKISKMLQKEKIKHNLLNAKYHEKEADKIAQAGRLGAVTIATNMAGRGTDIMLGGNPEYLAKKELKKQNYSDEEISLITSYTPINDEKILNLRKKYKDLLNEKTIETEKEKEEVKKAGGLYILGTERHNSRRIDNQLRGRSGRQGDPGESRFFISMEDDLLRIFGDTLLKNTADKIGMDNEKPLEFRILSNAIENAQKKVEGINFLQRKDAFTFDNILNYQREVIYKQRNIVLEKDDIKELIFEIFEMIADRIISENVISEFDFNFVSIKEKLTFLNIPIDAIEYKVDEKDIFESEKFKELLIKAMKNIYEQKKTKTENFKEIEKRAFLKIVDRNWVEHIEIMQHLQTAVNLHTFANEDPFLVYQKEGYILFEGMVKGIQEELVRYLMAV